MKVIFFAEGGKGIGLGHLRRSAILAEEFISEGDKVEFLTRNKKVSSWITSKYPNIKPSEISEKHKGDIVVIDSYLISTNLIKKIFEAKLIVGFEDFSKTKKTFDILIAPAYRGVRRKNVLKSQKYQIISGEFGKYKRKNNREEIKKILITLGGSSTKYNIEKIIKSTRRICDKFEITLIIGPESEYENKTIKIIKNPREIGAIFKDCDLAISSGGQTIFELGSIGVPTIVVGHALNQKDNIFLIKKLGILNFAGWARDENLERKIETIIKKMKSKKTRDIQSKKSQQVLDFNGAKRIVQSIKKVFRSQ